MTVEEAIAIIRRKTSIPENGEIFEIIEKAYDMAVEALEKADTQGTYPKPQRTHTIHKRLFLPQLRARICRNRNSRLLLPLRAGFKVG